MAQQQVRERHWCIIPHTSLSSTGVVKGVKSVDDLTSADLWHYQPVCDLRLYKFDIVVVDTVGHMKQFRQQFLEIFQIPGTQWSSIMQFQPILSLIQR